MGPPGRPGLGTGTLHDQGNDDDVQEVIHATSTTDDSVKYIFLLPERSEDKENKSGHDMKQNMGGRINCGTVRS